MITQISKTKINQRMRKKTNPALVETIKLAKDNDLLELAKKLSVSTKQQTKVNLDEIKDEKVIVPGKVLGKGNVHKKIHIFALSFSKEAEAKLKKAGCEIKTISEGIKNKELKGVKIL